MCNYLSRFKSSLAEIVKPLKRANTPQRSMVVALAAWPNLQKSQTCNCKCHEFEVFWWEQTMCATGRCQRHWFGTSIFTRGTTCGFHQHWNKLLKKFGHQGSMCYVLPVPVWQKRLQFIQTTYHLKPSSRNRWVVPQALAVLDAFALAIQVYSVV